MQDWQLEHKRGWDGTTEELDEEVETLKDGGARTDSRTIEARGYRKREDGSLHFTACYDDNCEGHGDSKERGWYFPIDPSERGKEEEIDEPEP
jgi:hypothetical protein